MAEDKENQGQDSGSVDREEFEQKKPVKQAAGPDVEPSKTTSGPESAGAEAAEEGKYPKTNPWLWNPYLYFMQGLPYIFLASVTPLLYENMGVANDLNVLWTSLITLPYSIKMLWAPLVDVNGTKRGWTLWTQLLVLLCMIGTAFALFSGDNFFALSLAFLFMMALFASTCDIATDGYYMFALNRDRQAFFVGIRSTFFRLATIFATGVVVIWAGNLINEGRSVEMAWALGVGLVATVYGVGRVWNGFAMPKAKLDQPVAVTTMADNKVHIYRTILVVAVFFTGYFTIAPIGRYLMHFLASALPQAEAIQVYLFDENYALDIAGASATLVPGNGFVLNAGLFVIMGLLTLALSLEIKRVMSGSVIGKSFSTFVLQKGFIAIFAFILLYRFAEGLVVKMVPLFLANEPEEGGMGMSTEAVGIAYGTLGVGGLVVGGILGGIIVAKLDLRKVFLPLASTIHIPNLLYWWASYNLPGRVSENYSMVEGNFLDKALYFFTPEFWAANTEIMQISGIVFLDQFGYGLGFAAYLVYLMQAAQRGEFVTSHYAIMTAMGALGLMVAGILSGVLENLFGFTGFFFAVVLFAIPGLATIYFIPYDRKPGPKGGGMAKKPEDEEQEAA